MALRDSPSPLSSSGEALGRCRVDAAATGRPREASCVLSTDPQAPEDVVASSWVRFLPRWDR